MGKKYYFQLWTAISCYVSCPTLPYNWLKLLWQK